MHGVTVVVGLQFGDEGKGRICQYLARFCNIGLRFNGGPNAGHTVYIDGKKHVLHQLPITALIPETVSIISPGVAISVETLEQDKAIVNTLAPENKDKIFVDKRCPIITEDHLREDKTSDYTTKIGTTGRGVGPCFEDHVARYAELFGGDFDSFEYLRQAILDNKRILCEGAQGVWLDLNYGTYPFVTSCSTTSGAVCTNAGIPFSKITRVIGVFKPYETRVGAGPFQSEIKDTVLAEEIRSIAYEHGATTGRPRRIGWLNLNRLKDACWLNNVTELAITKVDIIPLLKDFYIYFSKENKLIPIKKWNKISTQTISDIKVNTNLEKQLPQELNDFLGFIKSYLDLKISIVSYGTGKHEILRK